MLMQNDGPVIWYILHTITYNIEYKQATILEKNILLLCLKYFANIIPCNKCKKFYYYLYKNYNPINNIFYNKTIDWGISIHNTVNLKLNKPIKEKEYVDNIYKNKNIDNDKIINFLIKNLYSNRINILDTIKFITCFQYLYPDDKLKLKFIMINNKSSLLSKSNKFKYREELINKYREILIIK